MRTTHLSVDTSAIHEIVREIHCLVDQGVHGDALPKYLRDRIDRLWTCEGIDAVVIEENPSRSPNECAFVAVPTPELLCVMASLRALRPIPTSFS